MFSIALPSAVCAQAAGAGLSDEEVGHRALQLARELMSPFCPGRTLADCPSPNATVVKDEIRLLLASGQTEDQIRGYLSARYGDALVGTPKTPLGWFLPAGMLAVGVGLLAFTLVRISQPPSE